MTTIQAGVFHGVQQPEDGSQDAQGVLVVEFHSKGGPLTFTARESHAVC